MIDEDIEGHELATEPEVEPDPPPPPISRLQTYAALAEDGRVTQIASTNAPLEGWVEISQEDYDRLWPNPSHFKMVEGKLVEDIPPPLPVPTVIPKLELYRRMTDGEYAAMQQGVASQSKRIQDVFGMVENFREDDSLWPLLVSMGHQLFGEDRTAELLKPM